MAGSFQHIVDDQGRLLSRATVDGLMDNFGDCYEALEQAYGMIWFLAQANQGTFPLPPGARVEEAEQLWRVGITVSPGYAADHTIEESQDDGRDTYRV